MRYYLSILVVGFGLFSMFFGGGNLVFPVLIGINSTSPLVSIIAFFLSSILLPFYGVWIGMYFNGDYRKSLAAWGMPVAHVLIFILLLFWIPLGSCPRCGQLAYGAFCEITGDSTPLWLFSLVYSAVVYCLTLKRQYFLEILGRCVTPLLIFLLAVLIFALFKHSLDLPILGEAPVSNFFSAIVKGYNTMDFIAAIFFSSAIISLLKEKQKDQFQLSFVRKSCLVAIILLALVYLGLFFVGFINAESLADVSGARLLITAGHLMLGEKMTVVIFLIISLSVLSTSMALSLVFANYLQNTLFKQKVAYSLCLFISIFSSFLMSIVGFETLSVFISYIMSALYPILLMTTVVSLFKQISLKKLASEEKVHEKV